ncbi:hypothetical protein MMC10_000691 [Thelotrema lepadinum]|nr:hypothetical protein [Thelotrema lepadinum]
MSSFLPLPTTISTPRLLLRAANESDIPGYHLLRSDPVGMKYQDTLPATSIEETKAWFYKRWNTNADSREKGDESQGLGTGLMYVITLRSEGEEKEEAMVGSLGSRGLPHLGYMLHSQFWGKGIMTEAVRGFVGAVFETIPPFCSSPGGDGEDERSEKAIEAIEDPEMKERVRKMGEKRNYIEAGVDELNIGSWRVLEKVGFTRWNSAKAGPPPKMGEDKPEQGAGDGGRVWINYRYWRKGFEPSLEGGRD